MSSGETVGWLISAFATAGTLAVISWLGLLVTIAGFGIAIYQLSRIKSASEASAEAGKQVLNLVRERMDLTELVAAAGYVDSIRSYIVAGNNESATIFIELLRAKLISLRETLPASDASDEEIGRLLVDLSLVADQLRSKLRGREEVRQLLPALVPISDMLQRHMARLRFASETLPKSE
jgi:hypothetical protein